MFSQSRIRIICTFLAVLACATSLAAQTATETPTQRDARMEWWREARFGMFIHWGLYAVPAGTWQDRKIDGIGEWIMDRANIPVEDYEKLAAKFNPTEFDATQWVQIAKDAGMRYIVITSKHHDGFCLFDSDVTRYDVVERYTVQEGSPAGTFRPMPTARSEVLRLLLHHGLASSGTISWQRQTLQSHENASRAKAGIHRLHEVPHEGTARQL